MFSQYPYLSVPSFKLNLRNISNVIMRKNLMMTSLNSFDKIMARFFVSLALTLLLKMEMPNAKFETINNLIRMLLAHASLPPSFWHHALQMITYRLNVPLARHCITIPQRKFSIIETSHMHMYEFLDAYAIPYLPLLPSIRFTPILLLVSS